MLEMFMVLSVGRCKICKAEAKTISNTIGVCARCLKTVPQALDLAMNIHISYRTKLGLPPNPPQSADGVKCSLCVNECVIPRNGLGYCGVWTNDNGKLRKVVDHDYGLVYYYLDPLPTNCVATPVCPGATGAGYPKYAVRKGAEYGYYNLAVFFAGCNLDCIFCQNWDHKNIVVRKDYRIRYMHSIDELVHVALDDSITCICYFGGDPAPHAPYAISVSKQVLSKVSEKCYVKIKRICWETNGLENPNIMKIMAELSRDSGGIVKIDWKAWTPAIYQALTGINGEKALKRIMENASLVAKLGKDRIEVPLLVVSTLLVPGYVDVDEVEKIAQFLASLDIEVPYILLAFHPDHLLRDLPPTSTRHAEEAARAAKQAGLRKVFIENVWLLGDYY